MFFGITLKSADKAFIPEFFLVWDNLSASRFMWSKLPQKSTSKNLILKIFLGGTPYSSFSMPKHADCTSHNAYV